MYLVLILSLYCLVASAAEQYNILTDLYSGLTDKSLEELADVDSIDLTIFEGADQTTVESPAPVDLLPAQYICNQCNRPFKNSFTLKRHYAFTLAHGATRQYQCTHTGCSRSFFAPDALNRHIAAHGPKSFFCKFCPHKKYGSAAALKAHLKKKHSKEVSL